MFGSREMRFDNYISFQMKQNKSTKYNSNHISFQIGFEQNQLNITLITSYFKQDLKKKKSTKHKI